MRSRIGSLVLVLGLATLAGCGDDGESGARGKPGTGAVAAVPQDLGKLVPADAVAVVYAPSVTGLESRIRRLAGALDMPGAQVDLGPMIAKAVGPELAEHVDRSRPIAVALSVARASDDATGETSAKPSFTFLVPVKDEAAAKRTLKEMPQGMGPTLSGSYLVVGSSAVGAPAGGGAGSALLDKLPGGDVALRLDVARGYERFRDEFDSFLGSGAAPSDPSLEPGAGANPAAAARQAIAQFGEALRQFLTSTDRVDLGLWLEGGVLEAEAAVAFKDGSLLARSLKGGDDPRAVAALLPREFPIEGVWSYDPASMQELGKGWMSAFSKMLPGGTGAGFERMLAKSAELTPLMGSAMAFGMEFGPRGMSGAYVGTVKDGAAYLAKLEETWAASEALGVRMTKLPSTQVSGVEVRGYTMKLDFDEMTKSMGTPKGDPSGRVTEMTEKMMEKIYGGDPRIRYAIVKDRFVSTIGNDDALLAATIEAAKGGGKTPPKLAGLLSKGTAKTTFAMRVDMSSIASFFQAGVSAADPSRPAPAPVRLPAADASVLASFEGNTLKAWMSFDVEGFAKVMKEMMGAFRPAPPFTPGK